MTAGIACRRPAAFASALLLAGCATTESRVLPAYTLANGRVLQDVVTVAADGTGGAPVITSVTTYEVSSPGKTVLVARESASAPGPGLLMASGFGEAVGATATVVGAAVVLDHIDDDDGGGGTTVNSSYATSGNTARGGDAGDIDAVTSGFGKCGSDCSVSN